MEAHWALAWQPDGSAILNGSLCTAAGSACWKSSWSAAGSSWGLAASGAVIDCPRRTGRRSLSVSCGGIGRRSWAAQRQLPRPHLQLRFGVSIG